MDNTQTELATEIANTLSAIAFELEAMNDNLSKVWKVLSVYLEAHLEDTP